MAVQGSGIDLVPKEALDQIKELEKELQTTIQTGGNFLSQSLQINKVLSNQAASYKDVTKAVAEYNQMEAGIIAFQKQQQQIVQQMNKIREETVQQTGKEVKAAQDLRQTIQQTNTVRVQEKSLIDISRKAYEEAGRSIDEQRKQYVILQNETKNIQDQIKALDKEYANSTSDQKYISRKAELIGRLQDQRIAEKNLSDQIKYNNQIISTTIGTYGNLSAQYSRLKIEINQTSDAAKRSALEAHAKQIYEEMNRLQLATGKAQLQVGKYDLAVQDLTKTISILDPRIGAIINRGKHITPVKSAWLKVNDQLVKSLKITATTATVLQAAIVGLAVGGVLIAINAYKNWREELERNIELKKQLKDVTLEASKSAQEESLRVELLLKNSSDLNRSMNERISFYDQLDSIAKKYNVSLDKERILTGDVSGAYEILAESIQKAALAKVSFDQIVSNLKQIKEYEATINELNEEIERNRTQIEEFNNSLEGSFTAGLQKNIQNATKEIDKLNKNISSLTSNNEELKKSITDSYFKDYASDAQKATEATAGLTQLRVQNEINATKRIIDNTANEYTARLAAYERYSSLQIEAVRLNRSQQLNQSNLTAEQRKLIEEKAQSEITRIIRDAQKDQEKLQQEYNNFIYEAAAFRLSTEAQIQSEILSDNQKKYNERLAALDSFYNLQEKSIRLAGENQIQQVGLSESAKVLIMEKNNAELEKLQRERNQTARDLIQVYIKEQTDAVNDISQSRLNAISYSEADDLKILAEQYRAGEINKQQYEQRKTDITIQYARERLETELQTLDELLQISGLTEQQITDIRKQQRDAQLKYDLFINKQIVDADQKAAKQREDIEKKLTEARKKLMQEVLNFAGQIASNIYTSQVNRLDQQLSDLSDYYDKQNEVIDEQEKAGIVTAEYAAAQRKYLTDEQARQEEDLQEQRKEILIRQAKFEKAQAAISAAINTAVGITKLWVSPGFPQAIPLAATLAAIGAAQIATIAAQPLPQYRLGTSDHPGGPAIVGDGGRPEMAIFPDGSILKTPATPTVMNLPEHTQVLPDFSKALLAFPEISVKEKAPVVIQENKRQLRLLEDINSVAKATLHHQRKERANSFYFSLKQDARSRINNRKNY